MAECGRSGKRVPYSQIAEDGMIDKLLVSKDWWEPRHPQENIASTTEASGLYRPTVDEKPTGEGDPAPIIGVPPVYIYWGSATVENGRWCAPVFYGGGQNPLTVTIEWEGAPSGLTLQVDGATACAIETTAEAGGNGTLRATVTDAVGQTAFALADAVVPFSGPPVIDTLMVLQNSSTSTAISLGVIPLDASLEEMPGRQLTILRDRHNAYGLGGQCTHIANFHPDGWMATAGTFALRTLDGGFTWGAFSQTSMLDALATTPGGQFGAYLWTSQGLARTLNAWTTASTNVPGGGIGDVNNGFGCYDPTTKRFLFPQESGIIIVNPNSSSNNSAYLPFNLVSNNDYRAVAADGQGNAMVATGSVLYPWYLGKGLINEYELTNSANWSDMGAETTAFGDVIDLQYSDGKYVALMTQTIGGANLIIYTSDEGASFQSTTIPVAPQGGRPAMAWSHRLQKWMFAIPRQVDGTVTMTLAIGGLDDGQGWETYDYVSDVQAGGTITCTIGCRNYSPPPPEDFEWKNLIWSSRSGFAAAVTTTAFGANTFVAAGSGNIYYSSDADSWTLGASGITQSVVRYANGLFFAFDAVGPNYRTSVDGINWSAEKSWSAGSYEFAELTWAPSLGVYLIVSSSTQSLFTSSDGDNWTELTNVLSAAWPASHTPYSVAVTDSGKVLVGSGYNSTDAGARMAVSTDLSAWTDITAFSDETFKNLNLVCRGIISRGNTVIAIVDGYFITSIDDGVTWAIRSRSRQVSGQYMPLENLIWDGQHYLCFGKRFSTGHVYLSVDGLNWFYDSDTFILTGLSYGNGVYAAMRGSTSIWRGVAQ